MSDSKTTRTRWNLPPGGDNADGPRPSDGAITGIDGPDPNVPIKHDQPTAMTNEDRLFQAHHREMVRADVAEQEVERLRAKLAETELLRVTHDPEYGLAYVYIAGPIPKGGAKRQIRATDNIILDLDADGHVIGIELLSDALLHPSLKAIATQPKGKVAST